MPPQRQHTSDQQFRRLGRQRREPLHQQELVDAELPAGDDQCLRERFRSRDHDGRRDGEQRRHRDSP